MFELKHLLLAGGVGLFVAAVTVLAYDFYSQMKYHRGRKRGLTELAEPEPVRWRTTVALAALAWAPMLIALSIVVGRCGMAGVHVEGVLPREHSSRIFADRHTCRLGPCTSARFRGELPG